MSLPFWEGSFLYKKRNPDNSGLLHGKRFYFSLAPESAPVVPDGVCGVLLILELPADAPCPAAGVLPLPAPPAEDDACAPESAPEVPDGVWGVLLI